MFDGLFIVLSGIEKGDLSLAYRDAMLEDTCRWIHAHDGTWDSNFDAILSWLI